jgi:hypothetical protein
MKTTSALVISLAILSSNVIANNEDPAALCTSAAKLFQEGDIDGALDEARWCVNELEQLKQNQTAAFFKDNIAGYSASELSQQSAMGMTVTERTYTKGNEEITVSLTGGASSGAMGAFSALAQLGGMAGNNKIRIQKRTALVNQDGGETSIMVTLKSGGMLNFSSYNSSKEKVIAFAKAFPIKTLDQSLQE